MHITIEKQCTGTVFKIPVKPKQLRSGQVRVFNCTFRASCCNARLSRAQVLAFAGSFVMDRTGAEPVK